MRRNALMAAPRKMPWAVLIAGFMTLGICTPCATGQRGLAAPHLAFNRGSRTTQFPRAGSLFYPLALPLDAYYADALNAGYPIASQPPVVIVQPSSASAMTAETQTPGEPVLIELQGDTYVRLSGPPVSGAATFDVQRSVRSSGTKPTQQTIAQRKSVEEKSFERAPVVLIFRDGHREDISDYVIANGTLYAHTSYYTSGAWTKSIDVAALDVFETASFNQSHGVRFLLPSAANEVIVGP